MDKRFKVALSFAGEKREFVREVACYLSQKFGSSRILYDRIYEVEFGKAKLKEDLANLYRLEAELIVAIICPNYPKKEWCRNEQDVICSLIKEGNIKMVMLSNFNGVVLEDLNGEGGYIPLDNSSPEDFAINILVRLAQNEGKNDEFYLSFRERSKYLEKLASSLYGKKEWDFLVKMNSLYLPAPTSLPSPSPPRSAPKISALYLMVQVEETGEPDRLSLIPELDVEQDIKSTPAEWHELLRAAEDELKPNDNVSLEKKTDKIKSIGSCLKEWLSLVDSAAAKLSTNSNDLLPVVLELFLPHTLLQHDFGDLIRVPRTLASWPLGASYPFMVRSLDRARDHANPSSPVPTTFRNKWRDIGKLRQMLLVSSLCGEVTSPGDSGKDPWHDEIYSKTQREDVGICVVLPGLSCQPGHHDLLATLVDSWLPLVVFWSDGSGVSSPASTKITPATATARLAFVGDLLEAAERLDATVEATNLDSLGFQLAELAIKELRLAHLANRRKQLRCSGAHQNGASKGHAIVLMDDPDRWPRRLITSSG
jgi:hypothetical protein